jgi:hypothetical protein
MFKIAKAKWPELWQALAREGQLYLPALVDGKTDFAPWQKDTKVDLLTAVTAKSLKQLFFAQVEPLMHFQTSGKKVAVTPKNCRRSLPSLSGCGPATWPDLLFWIKFS